MADWTRNLAGDYPPADFTTVDGNVKLAVGGGPPLVELAPDADVFGDVINHWTEMSGTEIWSILSGKGTAAFSEAGGILTNSNGGDASWTIAERRNNVSYLDIDVVFHWTDTKKAIKSYGAFNTCWVWAVQNTGIRFFHYVRANSPGAYGNWAIAKVVNGAATAFASGSFTPAIEQYFRIKVIRGNPNVVTAYKSTDGINWVNLGGGNVFDATHFHAATPLYPIIKHRRDISYDVDFTPEITRYYQETSDIAAQRFWPDSPECNVINSAAGAVEYVADMAVGNTFAGSGFACTKLEPGASTVLFKLGFGDTADRASATWDGTWRTEAALDAKVANGDFDGHRYLFLKAQFNSDSTDQPALTDITISGAAVGGGGMTGPFGNLNKLSRSIA